MLECAKTCSMKIKVGLLKRLFEYSAFKAYYNLTKFFKSAENYLLVINSKRFISQIVF